MVIALEGSLKGHVLCHGRDVHPIWAKVIYRDTALMVFGIGVSREVARSNFSESCKSKLITAVANLLMRGEGSFKVDLMKQTMFQNPLYCRIQEVKSGLQATQQA